MTSSLIQVNLATPDELQTLKGIGPRRAERIVEYRTNVAQVRDFYDLSMATGLGLKQAYGISDQIIWSDSRSTSMLAPGLILTGVALLIVQGLSRISLDISALVPFIVNLAILFVMAGSISTALEFFIRSTRSQIQVPVVLMLVSVLSFVIGIGLLVVVIVINLLTHQQVSEDQGTTDTIIATVNFLLFVTFIALLLYGPGIQLNRIKLFGADVSKNLIRGARLFDMGQLLIALIALAIILGLNSDLWVEEVFALWASVLLVNNGLEQLKGQSAFVALLGEQEKAALRFLLFEESGKVSLDLNQVFQQYLGVAAIVLATLLTGISLYRLVAYLG